MKEALPQPLCHYIDGVKKESQIESGKLVQFIQSPFLMDFLSCALLASGLSSAFMTMTGFEDGFLFYFSFACLSTLAAALFFRRWWIAPAAAGSAAAAAGLCLLLTDKAEAFVSYWAGFFTWAFRGARYDEAYSESAGEAALKAAVVFIAVLLCFLFIRRLYSLTAISLFVSDALIAIYYFGRDDLSVPVCVCVSGIVILIPRSYSRYVSQKSGGDDGAADKQRGTMQAVAVPAAVIAVLFALFITPEDTSGWKSRGLTNIIADVAYMVEGPFSSHPSNTSSFSMKSLGFGQQDGRMGGPVKLTDERYLTLNTEYPMLLRGAVMDYYTGESWLIGAPDGDLRFDSPFWQGYKRDAFGLGKPLGNDAKKLFEELTDTQLLTINYQTDKFSTLFSGGMVNGVGFKRNSIAESIYFNMRSELYLHYRVPAFAGLELKTRVWKTGLPDFERRFLALEKLAQKRGDKNFSNVKGRYTHLPDTLPESVKALALDITAGSNSSYQKAKAIESWLQENCEYTLEPVIPPENTDFVAHFLDTKEGYCTYYASAMAVLARCAGLPSRYVTGFGLERDSDNKTLYIATGKTAHAWTEIYFEGIGWLEFDPLGWNPEAPINGEPSGFAGAAPQPEYIPRNDSPMPEESSAIAATAQHSLDTSQVLSIFAAAASLCLAAWFAVCRIMRRKLKIYEAERVSRKIPDMGDRIDFYFDDILKQLAILGIAAYAGETLTAFSKRADSRLMLEGSSVGTVAGARMRMHFAQAPPTAEDFKDAHKCHLELELLLRERLSGAAYFFKRAVQR